ncbi:MAG: hypothetical protein ACOYL3_26720 [Desulfuromonadaceae bacterium]
MKVIINKKEMRDTIKLKVVPSKIAVAYIGENTERYIDFDNNFEAIIVRPTLGTNPEKIIKIAEIIGWDKIYLLSTLHAKIYLGSSNVLFGSCNLSNNGLGDIGLHEIAAYSDSPGTVNKISGYFDVLLEAASEEYPDEKSKKYVIEQLKRSKPLSFYDLATIIDNIPLMWWTETIEEYSPTGLDKYDSPSGDYFEEYICEEAISVTEKCNIRPGQFVLMYQLRESNLSVVKKSIRWLYVHKLEHNFVVDDEYSSCAIQLKDVDTPIPPFKIDENFKNIFVALMDTKPRAYRLKNIEDDAVMNDLWYKESLSFLNEIKTV